MSSPARGFRPTLRVLKWSALVGFAELRTIYTWRTWVFGWLGRTVAQVMFFVLIGKLLASPQRERYLLIGNAVMVAALEASVIIASTAAERWNGTLPLLVASPHGHLTSMLGRGVHWLCTGLASSAVALAVPALVFDIWLPWPAALWVLPLILLTALSTYALSASIAAFAIWVPELSLPIMNATYLSLMSFCGVMVPTSFWPSWIETLAAGLPVTHGLAAVRTVLDEGPWQLVVSQAATETVVGGCWLAVALLSYHHLARLARKSGAIEFGED